MKCSFSEGNLEMSKMTLARVLGATRPGRWGGKPSLKDPFEVTAESLVAHAKAEMKQVMKRIKQDLQK